MSHLHPVEFDHEPGTVEWFDDWHEWRDTGLGSSDIAASYSGDYGGAYKVVAEMLGVEIPASEQIKPEDASRGRRWEKPIADMVHLATGYYVAGEQMPCEHPDDDRRLATVDGVLMRNRTMPLVELDEGVEIKTRRPGPNTWKRDYWASQCRWHMHVTGCSRWLLVVATIDTDVDPNTGEIHEERIVDLRTEWIYRDAEAEAELVDLFNWLWGHIERGELPDPQDHYALPYVTSATSEPGRVRSDDEVEADTRLHGEAELVAGYEAAREAEKAAEQLKKLRQAELQAAMGEAREAFTDGGEWRVRYGERHKRWTDESLERLIGLHSRHVASCEPDCQLHRPDLLAKVMERADTVTRVSQDVVAEVFGPEVVDELKESLPRRTLTVKRMSNTEENPK